MNNIIPLEKINLIDIINSAPDSFEYEPYIKLPLEAGFRVFNSGYNLVFDIELINRKVPRYIDSPNSLSLHLALNDNTMLEIDGYISPSKFEAIAYQMTIYQEKEGDLDPIFSAISQQCPTLEQYGGNEQFYNTIKNLFSFAQDDSVLHPDWFVSASEILQAATEKADWQTPYNSWFKSHTGHLPLFYTQKSLKLNLDILNNYKRYQLEKHFYC